MSVTDERWQDVRDELESIDNELDEKFEGGSPTVEREVDELTRAWVKNIHATHHRINDELAKVVENQISPREAVENAAEAIENDVINPYRNLGIDEFIEEYNNYAEVFSAESFSSPEELPLDRGDDLQSQLTAFHPNTVDLLDRYETLVNLYGNVSDDREKYSWRKNREIPERGQTTYGRTTPVD